MKNPKKIPSLVNPFCRRQRHTLRRGCDGPDWEQARSGNGGRTHAECIEKTEHIEKTLENVSAGIVARFQARRLAFRSASNGGLGLSRCGSDGSAVAAGDRWWRTINVVGKRPRGV
jgi:hypothetical protein